MAPDGVDERALGRTAPPGRDLGETVDLHAEEALVSACMIAPDEALPVVVDIVKAGDFVREGLGIIYRGICDLWEDGMAVDPITLDDHLKAKGESRKAGGIEAVADLLGVAPGASSAEQHAKIVADKAMLRRLTDASRLTLTEIEAPEGRDAREIAERVEARVFEAVRDERGSEWQNVDDVLWDAYAAIDERSQAEDGVIGIRTGFPDIDKATGGLKAGELTVIAARPSMGKTAWVLNAAAHAAEHEGHTVAFFSLEMGRESLMQRIILSEARVTMQAILRGLSDADNKRLSLAGEKVSGMPLWIDDRPALSPLEMRARARRLQAKHGLDLVVVDYLQLMRGSGENRTREIGQISRSLKELARSLEVPVVPLSQLSRAPERRDDKRPQLSDLRESGDIEQDADVVAFLYRPEYYFGPTKNGKDVRGKAEFIIGKQRNGPTGTIKLHFQKEYARFDSAAGGGVGWGS